MSIDKRKCEEFCDAVQQAYHQGGGSFRVIPLSEFVQHSIVRASRSTDLTAITSRHLEPSTKCSPLSNCTRAFDDLCTYVDSSILRGWDTPSGANNIMSARSFFDTIFGGTSRITGIVIHLEGRNQGGRFVDWIDQGFAFLWRTERDIWTVVAFEMVTD